MNILLRMPAYCFICSRILRDVNVSEWTTEMYSDVAMLLSKCEDVFSADVPAALQVSATEFQNFSFAICPMHSDSGCL